MTTLIQHPLSAAFPAMSEGDFLALRDNIDDHGQREPITVYDGMVLDGWHRYRACEELGFECIQMEYAGDDPVAFVASLNLHRRHLTGSQRAAAVVACNAWVPSGVNQHTKTGGGEAATPPPKTTAQLATEAKVSEKTIKDAKAAHQAGLGDAVKDGALTAEEAARVARGVPAKAAKPKLIIPTAVLTQKQIEADQIAEDAHGDVDIVQLLDEAQAEIKVLQAQVTAASADDAKAEAMKWQRIAAIAQNRQNELMATVNEREGEIKRLMKALRRCGAAVGEDDPTRIASTVEAFVRSMKVPA